MRSSWQNPRGKGGAFGFLLGEPDRRGVSSFLALPCLQGYARVRTKVLPFHGPDPEEFDFLQGRSARRALFKTECHAGYVGLVEPFKVRTITRGDADIYALARRFQRVIHPLLSRHPAFNLIASPIQQHHLDRFAEKLTRAPGTFLVSGDYESATDLLDPELSEHCLARISDRLGISAEFFPSLRLALTRHTLHGGEGIGRRQRRGQLMGSPISFPILCIVNAAATRLAMEMRASFETLGSGLRTLPLDELPLLINGDDVGFETDAAGYALWKHVTQLAGLKFSLGKNFTHRDWLILNSQLFRCSRQVDYFGQSTPRLWRKMHFSAGLLWGSVKKDGQRLEESLLADSPFYQTGLSLAGMARDLIEPFPPAVRDRLLTKFLTVHRESIQQTIPPGMSYWAPRHLGGLGLPVTREVELTRAQLLLAAYLSSRTPDQALSLLSPDMPEFLGAYLSEVGSLSRRLESRRYFVTLSEYRKSSQSLRGLSAWTALGCSAARRPDEIRANVLRGFRSCWKRAMAASGSLSPMRPVRCLNHQQLIVNEPLRWS